ncbi:MAG: hypothetical protein CMA70_04745 [Euryarchaeota archaeon]|nr:hypothetical protein [Euryarchaeota archaeon]
MPIYEVEWTKTYYATGTIEIEASDEEAARRVACRHIGDYSGSLEWDDDDSYVEVIGTIETNEDEWTSSSEKSIFGETT